MPRKKNVAAAQEPRAGAPDPLVEVVRELRDKLGAEVVEAPPPAPAEVAAPGESAAKLPEPHELDSIELGPQKGSPRVRLFRSNRFQQMQIRFDE